MIKAKKKICIDCKNERYIWSHGRCKTCDAIHRNSKAQSKTSISEIEPLYLKSNTTIPKRTKKRSDQEKEYAIICGIIDREAKESGNWKCWFCGSRFQNGHRVEHHHINGRENDRLTRKEDLRLVHHDCHASYHNKSIHKISWYPEWLERIKDSDSKLYEKELLKYNK